MSRNLVNNTSYHKKAYIGIGLAAVGVMILCLILAAVFVIPNMAIYEETSDQATIVSIVPENSGLIGVGADTSLVYVTVQYSDGSTESVALSELITSGLDLSSEYDALTVVLNYGGFEQEVTYQVTSTMKTVEYVASTGGRINGDSVQYIYSGGSGTTVIAVADEGYEFVEWSDGSPNAIRTDTSVSSDLELIATFQKQTFTVVFYYPNGTTSREEIVSYGEAATTSPDPDMDADMAKYGYVFTGWSQSFDSITANTNVYPLYEKYATDVYLSYTTDVEGNNLGVCEDLEDYYPKDEIALITVEANFEKVFVGWSILTYDGTWVDIYATGDTATLEIFEQFNYIQFTTSGLDTIGEYTLTFTPTSETDELYIVANFEYEESTISFTSMGSSGVFDAVVVDRGQAIGDVLNAKGYTLAATDSEYKTILDDITGYTFKGWYIYGADLDANGDVVIINDLQTFAAPTTLVASWEKNTYTVTFDFTGTDLASNYVYEPGNEEGYKDGYLYVIVDYQDPISNATVNSFPTTSPTLDDNYTFMGWYLYDTTSQTITDTVVNRNYKISGDITVAPKFEVNTTTLSSTMTGSGAVYAQSVGDSEWVALTGSYEMAVVGYNYYIKIVASYGYTIDSISYTTSSDPNAENITPLSSEIITDSQTGESYYIYEGINPKESYYFEVSFKQATNTVSVNNVVAIGSIEYINSDGEVITSSSESFNVEVDYNTSLSLWVSAPYGYYISDIKLNSTTTLSVPSESILYTIIIENVTSDVSVTITYVERIYTVDLPTTDSDSSTALNGSITSSSDNVSNGSYSYGDEVAYDVVANTGYYIKALIINGYYVDPYADNSGISISNILINTYSADTEVNNAGIMNASSETTSSDYRITSYTFTIDSISADMAIEVVYAEIYYTVTASVDGSGWTNISSTQVARDGSVVITATCYDGNYIASYVLNGEEHIQSNATGSLAVSISDITEDTTIIFTTAAEKYNISYTNIDEKAELSYDNGASTIAAGKNANFASGSNQTFTITAEDGYYISSVSIDGGASVSDLAYNATTYYVTFNGLDSGHSIAVVTAKISYTVTVYLGNAGTSSMTIGGVSSATAITATIDYESSLTINLSLENGKYISSANNIDCSTTNAQTSVSLNSAGDQITITPIYSDMVVFIPLADNYSDETLDTYTVTSSNQSGGTVTLTNDFTEANSDTSITVSRGADFSFSAVAESGYELKYLVVDGESVAFTTASDGTYSYAYHNIQNNMTVDAVFGVKSYTLSLTASGNGTATTASSTYNYGDTISIRINAYSGYALSYISVSKDGATAQKIDLTDSNLYNAATGECNLGSAYSNYALTIEVGFEALSYQISVSLDNSVGGSVGGNTSSYTFNDQYGEIVSLALAADSGNYIDVITVNGVNIDPSTLGGSMDTSVQKYVTGTLMFTVTAETEVVIQFAANQYLVSVTETANGTVGVREKGATVTTSTSLYLSNGVTIELVIDAVEGYHISEIMIGGTVIDENEWKADATAGAENVNSNIVFEYANVSTNLSIKVTFEVNNYDIALTTVNNSVNFSEYDTTSSSYGTLSIYGYTAKDGVVYDVQYGSSIIFIVSPVSTKGYYVSSFTISYYDPEDEGALTTKDYTAAAADNQVEFGVEYEIVSVIATFSKYTYTVDVDYQVENYGSSYYATDSGITVSFSNPYDSSAAVKTINGNEYEYGITYVVTSTPGVGYSREELSVNGTDRNSSVRNNMYSSTVTEDIKVVAYYAIDILTISITANIFDGTILMGESKFVIETDTGDEVWKAATSSTTWITTGGDPFTTNSGVIWVDTSSITVTYGTLLYFIATPDNSQGYMLSSIRINNVSQSFADEDSYSEITYTVLSDMSYTLNMALHTYSVGYAFDVISNGAKVTLSSTTVDWGKDSTLTITVYSGYSITGVSINGVSSAEAYNALKSYSTYKIQSIKANTVVTIIIVCNDVDIQFGSAYNGGVDTNNDTYNDTYHNVSVDIQSTTTGSTYSYSTDDNSIIDGLISGSDITGAKYSDKITIYFYPVEGYEMTEIRINMYNQNGNLQSQVVSVNSLTYDSVNHVYYYVIDPLAGKLVIDVVYTVRTYSVTAKAIGGGNINLGLDDSGSPISLTTLSHYSWLQAYITADYGYHLASLTINGVSVLYTIDMDGNIFVYELGTDDITYNITDNLLNGYSSITIVATFAINEYDVVFVVNGTTGSDATLTPSIVDNSIQYSTNNSYITQETAEGYSITSIVFANNNDAEDDDYQSKTISSSDYNLSMLSFVVSGEVMDLLNYHEDEFNTLYVYYVTALDTHEASAITYLVEDGVSEDSADADANSLVMSVDNIETEQEDGATYDYFATIKYTFALFDSDLYYFAGFQEYNTVTKSWEYVSDGVDGITLYSAGTELSYTINGDREFRAVVFRIYTITVTVYPEYKYISGTNSNSTVDMVYRQYASLTASVTYNSEVKPNIDGVVASVGDSDNDSENGVYVYKIYSGSMLTLSYIDSITATNRTTSVGYYDSDTSAYFDDGTARTGILYGMGVEVTADRAIDALFMNTVKVTFFTETEGSNLSTDGATITYTLAASTSSNTYSATPSSGVITTTAGAVITVTIVPKDNYEFDSLTMLEESINSPDTSGNLVWSGEWVDVVSDSYKTVEYTYTNGVITKVVMTMIVTENAVFNMSFIKMVYVTSDIYVLSDDVEQGTYSDILLYCNDILISDNNSDVSSTDEELITDTLVEYNTSLTYTIYIPADSYSLTNSQLKDYQFMGFTANGVLNHTSLGSTYPTMTLATINGTAYYSYSVTYVIADYDSSSQRNGVTIGENNGQFEVSIYAYISPIYNIVVSNEYLYDYNENKTGDEVYFDTGILTATSSNGFYDLSSMSYNMSTNYIYATTEDNDNSVFMQMLDQQNSGRIYSTDASSDYNTWTDTEITLNWASSTISSMQSMYSFVSWQYYGYSPDSESDATGWYDIPYTYNNGLMDSTATSYTFPISSLYDYIIPTEEYGDADNVITIRASFQRQIEVTVVRDVYYDGVNDTAHEDDNPAYISLYNSADESYSNSGDTSGIFKYYDDVVIMVPQTQTGYDFDGWYYRGSDGEDVLISSENYPTTSNMYLVGNNLILYVTDDPNIYDAATNTITIYAKYTKTWTVTFQITNLSGSSTLMRSSIPTISYVYDYTSKDKEDTNLTLYSITVRAGEAVDFYFNTSGTSYAAASDIYQYTTTTVNGTTYIWSTSGGYGYESIYGYTDYNGDYTTSVNSMPNTQEVGDVCYTISGDGDKKIVVNYQSYATLTVDNIYYGSTLVLNSELAAVVGISAITDGGTGDDDGSKNGSILIEDIPIVSDVSYNGGYGVKLAGASDALPVINSSEFGIDFSGDSITSKAQSFSFYTVSYTNADGEIVTIEGVTDTEMPFYMEYDTSGNVTDYGEGSITNPYMISTATHLIMIDSLYQANNYTLKGIYFKLVDNIALDSNNGNFCSTEEGFDGVLDGNGYTISNIYLTTSSTSTANIGLFAKIYGGKIYDLNLSQITIARTGGTNVGALAGSATDAILSNITIVSSSGSTAISIVGYENVGGLVGLLTGTDTAVSNITVNSVVIQGSSNIGGAFGSIEISSNSVEITNIVVNNPTVSASVQNGGGAIGSNNYNNSNGTNYAAVITEVTVYTPTIKSEDTGKYLGGVIGYNAGYLENAVITGDASVTSVTNSAYLTDYKNYNYNYGGGGIAGYNAYSAMLVSPSLGITNSDSTDFTLTMNGSASGGIVGINAGTVTGSNTNDYTIYINRAMISSTASEGGAYAAHVAYNLGTGVIINATTNKEASQTESSTTVDSTTTYTFDSDSVLIIKSSSSDNFTLLKSSSASGANSSNDDQSNLYVGMIAGINYGGTIQSPNIDSGKITVQRLMGSKQSNSTYVGGLIGYSTNSTSIELAESEDYYASNLYIAVYLEFWTGSTTASKVYLYTGIIAGNSGGVPSGSPAVDNCAVTINTVSYGNTYTTAVIDWSFSASIAGTLGSYYNYGVTYLEVGNYSSTVSGITYAFTNHSYRTPATSSLQTDKSSTGNRYAYTGLYRLITVTTV